ncbi:MAG: hypothetical protein AAFX56_20530 [Pseudomonadota bacterium]
MRILTRQSWLYGVVAAALLVQTAGPGALAAFTGKGIDLAAFFCAPSGVVSDEARAAAENMLAVFGIEEEQPAAPANGHCPACILKYGVPFPADLFVAAPLHRAAGVPAALNDSLLLPVRAVYLPVQRGPPTLSW